MMRVLGGIDRFLRLESHTSEIVKMIRFLLDFRVVIYLLIIVFPSVSNSYDEDRDDEFEETFSEYLISSGEYFCVSELFGLCFSEGKVECGGESDEYKSFCLSSVKPLYSSGGNEFDPNIVLNKYLNCIVDKQLSSFPESERGSYKDCLGPRFKNK